ncbi:Uncharacterised protein [Mycobacteroides abscessus subsp. massiliense]|nr:Uncharacterised protein [Mycobacteroides abscessus subsp. massiliense]
MVAGPGREVQEPDRGTADHAAALGDVGEKGGM